MKKLLFAVAILVLLGVSAYSSVTRVLTMGDVNMIVKDVANISLFPQTINYYPNLFLAENDDDDYFWSVGAHFKFAENSSPAVLGAYFSEDDYYNSLFYDEGHGNYTSNNNNRIALIYGRELAGNPFGLALRYFRASDEATYERDTLLDIYDYLDNYEYSLSRFEFGAGITLMEKKLELAVGLAMTSWTDKEYYIDYFHTVPDTIYGDYSKPDGNIDLTFNARYWMDPMGKYTLIPHFSFVSSKQGLDYHPGRMDSAFYDVQSIVYRTNTVYEDKYSGFNLGLGMNYEASEKVLVVGDIGMWLETDKEKESYQFTDVVDIDGTPTLVAVDTTLEDKWNWTSLPYFRLGIDAEVFKWLDLRAGVETWWVGRKYQPAKDSYEYVYEGMIERKIGDVETDTYLGAGFHWNNLTLDAQMDPQFLTNGPYFISGDNEDGYSDFAWRLSLIYGF